MWCSGTAVKMSSSRVSKCLKLTVCGFVTIFLFTQNELEKERAIRKDLENRISALEKQLSSKMETQKDELHLRRQVKRHQHAATRLWRKNKQLLFQIKGLSLDNAEKEVSHCNPCH
jgi:hypothetical protein